MSEVWHILEVAFSLPTVVFTVLLILVSLYWVVALLGVFSIEAVEGLGEAAEGLGEAAAGLSEAAEGLSEAAEGLTEAAEGGGGFLGRVGFGDLPRSITWSLIVFFGWVISMLGGLYVPGYRELVLKGVFVASLLGLATLALAVVVTGLAIQPLRHAVLAGAARSRRDLVGQTCTLRTGRVDRKFGQAELDDGGLIQVRLRGEDEGVFARGARLWIQEYDAGREVFYVTTLPEESPS